ncbi:TrbG/VirB9 family P-type conjugative transfer protein [Pseudomonas fragariae (ex Marin et al. 2024)]|uniref:TrbG/VirB9 family P-type conjugative transfer protein n=1 Tax=Pseudomonas fragariae (ex Marin et al. 2024) TaxID=3080056 RepID=UPI003F7A655E
MIAALGMCSFSVAETMGDASFLDKRVQTALYSPDQVYRIQSSIGRGSLLQFAADETVMKDDGLIVAGDPDAWTIGVNKRGNMVTIKPKTTDEPNTNLIVNTNRNTYLIELKLVDSNKDTTYALRFRYPEPPKKPAVVRNVRSNPCDGPSINRDYQRRGDLQLSPTEAWDDGTLTCFRFATNAPRPAVYAVLPDGTETVVPTHNDQNVLVVHGVSQLFRFRLNKLVMEAKTGVHETGYNFSGTTTGETRELIHANE